MRTQLENEIVEKVRQIWGDYGIEYLTGALSSITSEEQLEALLKGLENRNEGN